MTVNNAAMEEWATASAARETDRTKPGALALGGKVTEDDNHHDIKIWNLRNRDILDHGHSERAHAGGGKPDISSASKELCSPPLITTTIQKKFVRTCIRRLTI